MDLSIDEGYLPSPVKGRATRGARPTCADSSAVRPPGEEPSAADSVPAASYLPYVKQYPELKRIMSREEYDAFIVERAKRRERRARRKLERQQQQ